jgi:hypothetical protein
VRATALGALLVLALAGPVTAEPAGLTWQSHSYDVTLTLHGWLITDAVAFRRTEVGYGPSWNVGLDQRAARLSARLDLPHDLRARLDLDLAGGDPWVQEVWFDYVPSDYVGVRVGRLRVPFGYAQQLAVPDLRLPENPSLTGNPKDVYDVGVVVHGAAFGLLEWAIGAVTGSRDVSIDVNDQPDLVGRFVVRPLPDAGAWLDGLALGVSGSWGKGPVRHAFRGLLACDATFLDPPNVRGVAWRAGADLVWTTPWTRLVVEAQHLNQAREDLTDTQGGVAVGDLDPFTVTGFYVEGEVRVVGGLSLAGRFESMDFGDGDRTIGTENHGPLDDSWMEAITVGVNLELDGGVRFGVAWQGARFGKDDAGASIAPDGSDGLYHQLFARAQVRM